MKTSRISNVSVLFVLSLSGCRVFTPENIPPSQPLRGSKVDIPSYAETSESVKQIAADELQMEPSQIRLDAPLASQKTAHGVALDALDIVEVVMALEKQYGIVITDKEIAAGKVGKDELAPYKTVTLQRLINIVWREREKWQI